MKPHRITLVLFILTTVVSVLPAQSSKGLSDNFKYVIVYQNGSEAAVSNGTVILDRSTFEIRFAYKEPISFLVNASLTPESYNLLFDASEITEVPGFSGTGMAEGLRNDALDITLSSESPNAWFYDDKQTNRFDKNVVKKSGILSTRTVEYVRYPGEEAYTIGESGIKELYLCIVEYKYENYEQTVLSRTRLKLVFE